MEKLITWPKIEVGSFVYKQKLNCYNETGYASASKQGYCVICPEHLMGRSGNDIASPVYKLLETTIIDNPLFVDIITLSECIPKSKFIYLLCYP